MRLSGTGVFALVLASLMGSCADESEIDRDEALQGTWTHALEGTGYSDTLTLGHEGDLAWEHMLDAMVLSSGAGTWYTALATLTVRHEYQRDTTTGSARYIVPYAVQGDRACMLSCQPMHMDATTLSREVHMTDSQGRGPLRLDAADVWERWEFTLRSGGNCTARQERTLADSVGAEPSEQTEISSFSCIHDEDAGIHSFSVVWEEGDYPDSYVLHPFGDGYVLEEELSLTWTRASGP